MPKKSELLVEGNDDEHVMYALFQKYEVDDSFKVVNTGGISKLIESIPVRFKTEIDILGILIDSDTNIEERWNSIRHILIQHGYENAIMNSNGSIFTSPKLPKFGVWIMPDNNVNGMLED